MKKQPIQLLQLYFTKIRIELNPNAMPDSEPRNPLVEVYQFDGVRINSRLTMARLESEGADEGPVFELDFTVEVELDRDAPEKVPYEIEIESKLLLMSSLPKKPEPAIESQVAAAGADFGWAATRELVSNLSARMPFGAVNLPSMTFQGIRVTKRDLEAQQSGL